MFWNRNDKKKVDEVSLGSPLKPPDKTLRHYQDTALIVADMQSGATPVQWFNWAAEYLGVPFYKTPVVGSYIELDDIVLLNKAAIKWCKDNESVV